MYNSKTGYITSVQNLVADESKITQVQNATVIKSTTNTTQNSAFVTTYVDGTDANIIYTNSAPYWIVPSGYAYTAGIGKNGTWGSSGTYIAVNSGWWALGGTMRLNVEFSMQIQI